MHRSTILVDYNRLIVNSNTQLTVKNSIKSIYLALYQLIKNLGFSPRWLDTNYSISLTIIEGTKNGVPLCLGWRRNQGQPPCQQVWEE